MGFIRKISHSTDVIFDSVDDYSDTILCHISVTPHVKSDGFDRLSMNVLNVSYGHSVMVNNPGENSDSVFIYVMAPLSDLSFDLKMN